MELKKNHDLILIKLLQHKYNNIIKILFKIQNIVIQNELVLFYNKNDCMKLLNDIIQKINELYNNSIINIFSTNTYEFDNEIDSNDLLIISSINDLISINNFNDFGKFNNLYKLSQYNPLIEINNDIISLCNITGYTNIDDIIYLVLDIEYQHNYIDTELYNLLNNIFIPLSYTTEVTEIDCEIYIEKICNNELFLFNNQCIIIFSLNNILFKIKGYIKPDTLNMYIRTSQISNCFIYNKKQKIEELIKNINNSEKLKFINDDFLNIYMKNITITELLIFNEENFINQLREDYNRFLELNNMQFIKLIKLITKDTNDNLYIIYNTIKLLLLGSEENCSVASLLFNLLKDKKNQKSNESISTIIYNQLTFICQIKLKKSTFNIKNELDKLKLITSSDIDLKKQVLLTKNMPNHIKKICIDKIEELKNSNNEIHKIKLYVNILISFPWVSEFDDNNFKLISDDKKKSKFFLENVENKLNLQIYGHVNAKNKVLQILAKLISVQGSHISPIGLVGPPGVGKTKFAQCLAECLEIPFVQITLGGQNDGELLHGHGYTYSGAQPGLIVKKMAEAGSARCIMFFDELDKCVAKNGQVNELMSILIHLIDPMTNSEFQDRFFQEVTFPLNKVIFIFSFNDISKIDKILLDRIEILNIDSYNLNEKINIANNFLLKQLCKDIGFDFGSLKFSREILTLIIENYTFEAGIRSLKRCIENILLKLNIDRIYERGLFETIIEYNIDNPLYITKELILEYLGESQITYKCIHTKNMIGLVNGLYATNMCSGGIVPIQLTANHLGKKSKFILKLTGNQKKIMRESILYSFTTAINLLTSDAKELFFQRYPYGVHIHTPEASTPKDGPSAGVAFTLAFLSIMLNLKIDREIALTGEIDLYGNVSKIGGVKYKIQGAFKAKVKKVFLPIENKEDVDKLLKDMPDIFNNGECIFIDHIIQVAEKSLIDWDTQKHLIIF